MKVKMNRIFALLLAMSLLLAALAGCTQPSESESTGTIDSNTAKEDTTEKDAAEEDTSKEDTASDDIYEINMEVITWGTEDPDAEEVEKAVNAIVESEIGARLNFIFVPISEMYNKIGLMISGGEKIDLVEAGMLSTPSSLASQGLLMPMDEYLSDELLEMASDIIEACKYQDHIYAYPNAICVGNSVSFIYDADLAEEYHIDMPERIVTDEDWEFLFSQIKESGMPQYGITIGDGVNAAETWYPQAEALGNRTTLSCGVVLDMFGDDSTVVNFYETDAFKKIAKTHREWYEKGYLLPDSISNGYTTTDSITQGTAFGCLVLSSGFTGGTANYSALTGRNIASVPVGEQEIFASTGNVLSSCWGIASSCENPQKVCDFLNLMYTNTEVATLLNFGIEGKHYVKTEGSRIIDYPEGVDPMTVGYGHQGTSFGRREQLLFRTPTTDEFVENELPKYIGDGVKYSRYLGYTFDSTDYVSEVSNINAVIGTYAPSLYCGVVDPDEVLPQFIDELKAAGIDKVIEANQKQLDEWLANK